MGARVLLVEDDGFTRTALRSALTLHGVDVVATASGAHEAITEAGRVDVDAAILDLDLGPGPTGIDVGHRLRRLDPSIGIVLLTSFADPRLLAGSLADLPSGTSYVVKQSLQSMELLVAAVEAAIARTDEYPADPEVTGLTDAQIDTLRLLAAGLSNAEIARMRVVTEKSVEQAIARTAKRLNIASTPDVNQRVALARAYFRLTGPARHAHTR